MHSDGCYVLDAEELLIKELRGFGYSEEEIHIILTTPYSAPNAKQEMYVAGAYIIFYNKTAARKHLVDVEYLLAASAYFLTVLIQACASIN